ncbi:MAG TPA: hypothetical protein DCQ26_04255 [Marinilabiliales bacterium]|jgi:hypothetical protein|nr:hypothetical protein [Salinivirgaceae bacterium]OFX45976.1 MAG: hypothetical protein A2W95_03185 [Bacteroidetes bacterium GWA2_40_14]OFX61104.1 MAG: hypothetical protein A2W84_09670 [Bacteroidetes bacterium GWC2_40_13]OFX72708.1 MAG: hypothetical protein A2W96_18370 [Bacteroidetes bacterium GWD2_40_43]OFX91338.1 MAG: hypothetical protein A2W97_03790 [Bacteroidetes bacterium GWE2_40_63]OFY19408.1 MAG: hypothetical protein A2W88_01670 [Bacteroidetes bacterium GWF2_40_13]OFZ25559.1 MAG: hypot
MNQSKRNKIHFEPRIEIRPDLAFVETFQDGSQLIRKRGHMIIVEACNACLSQYILQADLTKFSCN